MDFVSRDGVLYFHGTRQRVEIDVDERLIEQTQQVSSAPNGLPNKRCLPAAGEQSQMYEMFAVPYLLPDETNRLRINRVPSIAAPVRLPVTPRDDLRPLYLNRQGLHVSKRSETLEVKENGRLIQEVRFKEINQVNVFGNVQLTSQVIRSLLEADIPLVMFSQHGYFNGMLNGTGLPNILLRREQFRMADDSARCLRLAQGLVVGKIRNQRVMLMRNHISPPLGALRELKAIAKRVEAATSLPSLLGLEGNAARVYFGAFSGMIKPGDAPMDPGFEVGSGPKYAFDFRNRNRRPPRDPVNAMLSLVYTLLVKDFTVAAASV